MDGADTAATNETDGAVDEERSEPPIEPLSTKNSFGTAMGAAMLGFEQALRNEPPAEILAAEHMPERGRTGDDSGPVIEFPDPVEVKDRPPR